MRRTIASLAVLGVLLISGLVGFTQGFPLGLLSSSDEPLDAFVWTMESLFHIGDPIVIQLRVSRPAFVYLFDLQPDGVVRLLFPNAFSADNYVVSTHQLPDANYDLIALPPTGIDELLVFATSLPLPFQATAPTDPFPLFAASPEEAIDRLVSLIATMDSVSSWGVGWTAIQIAGPADEPDTTPEPTASEIPGTIPAIPLPPPFISTPGDAWHETNGSWSIGVPLAGWYWYYGLEGHWHLCWVVDN